MVSSWHNLTEEQKAQERAKAKVRWYKKQRGQGGIVDAAEMQARIRKLHDEHHISLQRIADRTGVDYTNIKWHYAGRSFSRPDKPLTTCQWKTHNAIMTTRFGPADRKATIPAVGTHRRLRALIAAGYSQRWLADTTGRAVEHLNDFLVKNKKEVSGEHATIVEQVYRKYIDADPIEAGVPKRSAAYSRTVARKRSYLPGACWDDDTIEDPNAVPEWTGACGTEEGYRIHVRETLAGRPLPPCPACRAVVEVVRERVGEKPFVFHHRAFSGAMEARGINPRQLAIKMGRDPREADRFYRWRKGDRSPQNRAEVHAVAVALDVEVSDLMHDKPDDDARPNIIGQGAFNYYLFRAVMEAAGLSQHRVSKIVGVTHGSVGKWATGAYSPKDKTVTQPLADLLGIDVEVFYL